MSKTKNKASVRVAGYIVEGVERNITVSDNNDGFLLIEGLDEEAVLMEIEMLPDLVRALQMVLRDRRKAGL